MTEHHLAPGSFFQYILIPLIGEAILAWITTLVTFPSSLLNNCCVISLQHRKDKRGSEHEYLLATLTVNTPTGVQTRYMRVERRPSGSLGLFKRVILAIDSISISPNPFITDGSYSLYDLQFSAANCPTILDFAAMLETITILDSYYRAGDSNCYWFARMVFEGMAHAFKDGEVSPAAKAHQRGKFKGFPVFSKEGAPALGMSYPMKLWMRYSSAFSQAEAPGNNSEVSKRQRLVEYVYVRCRGRLHAQAARAEAGAEELARIDEDGASSPLYLETVLVTILCCLAALVLLRFML